MSGQIKSEVTTNLTTKRGHKRLLRRNNYEIAEYHQQQTIPRHFRINPDTRPGGSYGYVRRSRTWQSRKKKNQGHYKPLVYSGRLQQEVTSNSITRATSSRWTFNAKSYFPMTAQRSVELEELSDNEANKYVRVLGDKYSKRASQKQYRAQRKRKVR